MDIIYALAALQGLLLFGFLALSKNQSLANRMMAVYLLMLVFSLTVSFFTTRGELLPFHPLQGLSVGITFVCGPFVWIYAGLLTGSQSTFRKGAMIHFLPYVIYTLAAFLLIYGQPSTFKTAVVQSREVAWEVQFLRWGAGVQVLHSLVYYLFTYRLIKSKESSLLGVTAKSALIELKWLRWLLFIIAGISGVMATWFISFMVFGFAFFNPFVGSIINLLLFLLVYAMAGFALKYPSIFQGTIALDKVIKYQKSKLSSESRVDIWEELEQLMSKEQPFLDPELTMVKLADRLQVSQKTLSQVINESWGGNFFTYINHHRVKEFKRRAVLSENQHLTLVAIALGCGFASKSSFYSIFKKLEGLTPRQYLQSQTLDWVGQ